MASKIKLLALGCVASALLGSAQATVVTLDFDAIGLAAPSTVVGSTFTASDGVTFSTNAIANHNGSSSGSNVVPPPTRADSLGHVIPNGFVSNALVSRAYGDFTISFDRNKTYVDISLEWAAFGDFQITLFDDTGVTRTFQGNGSNWTTGWALLDLTGIFGDHRRIDHINFSNSTDSRFAIDNLRLAERPGGGTLPEPAGLGLVALALAGAGLASRRSRKV